MADRIVNNSIEFAYVTEHAEVELKRELEKFFLYQNILIIDSHFEFGVVINKLENCLKCKCKIARSFDIAEDLEGFDAVVAVNSYDIDSIKVACTERSVPYIVVLTKLCDPSIFKGFEYTSQNTILPCNYPLGIIFDISFDEDAKKFVSNAVLEISSLSFNLLQSKLQNLFFDEGIDYNFAQNERKIINQLQILIEQRKENIFELSKKVAQLYISYCLLQSQINFDVVDNLIYLCKKNEQKIDILQVKHTFRRMILSLEKNFFMFYTSRFASTINYELHQKNLLKLGIIPNFEHKTIPQNKVDFLFAEFRQKMLDFVGATIGFDKTIKNVLADIDVNNLYDMMQKIQNFQLEKYLSMEPDVFHGNDILSVLYYQGLLNFDL